VASLLHVPENVVKHVNSIIYNFLWNGKTDKVKRKILIQEIDIGGLNMIDFDNYVKAAKVKWIQRYLKHNDASWKSSFEYLSGKENLNVYLRSNFSLQELPCSLPNYYLDSISNWHVLRKKQKPTDTCPFIWYNECFKINNSTVYNNRLFQMGIWSSKDLFYKNVLIPFNQWMDRGAQHVDFLVWRSIVIILKKQNKN